MDLKELQNIQLDRQLSQHKNKIIVIVMILLFVLIIKGKISQFNETVKQLTIQEKQIAVSQDAVSRWKRITQEYAAMEKETLYRDEFTFKRLLEDKGKESGFDLDYIKPVSEPAAGYEIIRINMSGSGSYKDIMEYLRFLEDSKIVVEKLKISNIADSTKKKAEITCKGFAKGDQ